MILVITHVCHTAPPARLHHIQMNRGAPCPAHSRSSLTSTSFYPHAGPSASTLSPSAYSNFCKPTPIPCPRPPPSAHPPYSPLLFLVFGAFSCRRGAAEQTRMADVCVCIDRHFPVQTWADAFWDFHFPGSLFLPLSLAVVPARNIVQNSVDDDSRGGYGNDDEPGRRLACPICLRRTQSPLTS